MKDIEWLKSKIVDYFTIEESGFDVEGYEILDLIDELDEPETLSKKWIENHTASAYTIAHYSEEDVPVVTVYDLQNLLVPKLDLPVIPDYVADYINDRKEVGFPLYQAIRIVRENSRFEHSHLREWLWTNKGQETFARAWLDGYTVAKKKYYARSRLSSLPNFENDGENFFNTLSDLSTRDIWLDTKNSAVAMTKEEWAKLYVTENNAIFIEKGNGR